MSTKLTPITVVIADDHPIFRKGLRTVIEQSTGFSVAAEAENGREALEHITKLRPHVAVLDVDMPEMTGVQVAEVLRDAKSPTKVVFLTMFKEQDLFDEAAELGVMGYVLKDNALTELIQCLRSAARGEHYLSPSLSSFVFKRGVTMRTFEKEHPALDSLTTTERSVLRLVARQQTSKEIAAALNISVRTVEHHRLHIGKKLGLKGTQGVLKFALENRSIL